MHFGLGLCPDLTGRTYGVPRNPWVKSGKGMEGGGEGREGRTSEVLPRQIPGYTYAGE